MRSEAQLQVLELLIDYQAGKLSKDETIDMFQSLVNSGLVWKLEPHFIRTAKSLLKYGYIEDKVLIYS